MARGRPSIIAAISMAFLRSASAMFSSEASEASRPVRWSRNKAPSFRLEIEKMTAEEGALFLLHRTGLLASDALLENITHAYRKKAIEISAMMDCLPLA